MVAEGARICGRVGLHGGMTSYLGHAWWDLELYGCYCMGACIKFTKQIKNPRKVFQKCYLTHFWLLRLRLTLC